MTLHLFSSQVSLFSELLILFQLGSVLGTALLLLLAPMGLDLGKCVLVGQQIGGDNVELLSIRVKGLCLLARHSKGGRRVPELENLNVGSLRDGQASENE